MALSQSAVSSLLDAIRAGGSEDVLREAMALDLQATDLATRCEYVDHIVRSCNSIGRSTCLHEAQHHGMRETFGRALR